MSTLSKDLAQQIAHKLTEKTRLNAQSLKDQFTSKVAEHYTKTIPAAVKDIFKKHPDYFTTTASIKVDGHGFTYEVVGTKEFVINNTGNYYASLDLSSKEADTVVKLKRKYQDAEKKYKELKEETKQALLALKTYNNIRKELPEAAQYLPPPISNALVCNFDALKTKLKKQPEAKLQTVVEHQ